jgi:hypothetical protein
MIRDPGALYRQRRERFAAAREAAARRSRRLSWARLAVALGVLFALLAILLEAAAPPAWSFAALAAGVAVFAALAVVHGRVIAGERRQAERVAIQDEGLARLARDWDRLPPAPRPPEPLGAADESLSRDLGLFGPVSLARLLSTPRTPAGRETLAGWLLRPAPPEEARRRQAAVAELAEALEPRQELELAGRTAGGAVSRGEAPAAAGRRPLDAFLAWAEGEPWLLGRPALVWTSRLLPPVTVALGAAALLGAVPGSLAALPPLAALLVTWMHRERMERLFGRVAAGPDELATYAAALDAVEGHRFTAPRLAELAAALTSEGEPAGRWMRRLARRVESADARHGSFHVLVQVLTLWDFHTLWLLERWQAAAGRRVRRWLAALGELEALSALAALAWDHPGWAFPTVGLGTDDAGPPVLDGRGLGHPLIADDRRVGNDVTLGPPGTFLLVTGSNMSGKSTLLRALGVNVVLAQAGGPVCAEALAVPPLALGTSILVEDSLADGVSFFYAELLRLKQVVDLAAAAREQGRTLLYLLDEVLRGTNSRERRVAVTRVLRHLLGAGAIGAVSTHDLELGGVPEIAAAARPVHFRETLASPGEGGGEEHAEEHGRPAMSFDYRLRPGPATTTNALALLAAVGLDAGSEFGE